MIDEPIKKSKKKDEAPVEEPTVAVVAPPAPSFTRTVTPAPEYWSTPLWDGIKPVHKCFKCGTFRDDTDAMIEHVLLHYPLDEQEVLLDKLLAYAKSKEI